VRKTEGFGRFVEELQREVDEQAQAVYSAMLIEEAHHPSHIGRMDASDAYGRSMGWCGDMMEFYLRLDGECIKAVKFMTDGCGPTIACGNALARLVEGLTLEEAGDVTPERIVEALDGLPAEHFHCAELAVSTLQNAIFGWRFRRQEGNFE
jgi:nitrogen fixation NifU-like protein